MDQCTGQEILEELLRHLQFSNTAAIMKSSICIPCNLPYMNNIWLPRRSGDRPQVVPEGVTNLGLIGQYVELPQDPISVYVRIFHPQRRGKRSTACSKQRPPAAGATSLSGPAFDLKGVLAAFKVFLG